MYCLYNGEYGEHDLSDVGGLEATIEMQKTAYAKYIGTIVGDFTVLGIEYDWGMHMQRWHLKCNLGGEESYKYCSNDWHRGKGGSRQCKECRKFDKLMKQLRETTQKTIARRSRQPWMNGTTVDYSNHPVIGTVVEGRRVVEYVHKNQFRVECTQCGKKRLFTCAEVLKGNLTPCNHVQVNDYSDPKWIGMRNGHLTALSHEGKNFIAKCDCGNTVVVRGVELFTYKTATCCKGDNCPYRMTLKDAQERMKKGLEYEHRAVEFFRSYGYKVDETPDTGDYGVDLIMYGEDKKIAIQCKRQKAPATVSAVQQVYAGGRYYDCDAFLVISPSGFTRNAIQLAAKLGVVLGQHQISFEDFENARESCAALLETLSPLKCRRKYEESQWEIDGVTKNAYEWCEEYNINHSTVNSRLKRGISLKEALSTPVRSTAVYEAFGERGTLTQLCERYGMREQTVLYRMKQRGMNLEEALTAPKCTNGRKPVSELKA